RPFGYGFCLSLDQVYRPAGPDGPGHSSPQQAEGHPGWSSEEGVVEPLGPDIGRPFIPTASGNAALMVGGTLASSRDHDR
ncbi:MAG: hypothetical protein PVF54_04415, partial [Anaerolineae bacterium]